MKAEPEKIKPTMASAVRLRGRDSQMVTILNGATALRIANRDYDKSWSIQVGAFSYERAAKAHLEALSGVPNLAPANPQILPLQRGNNTLYRARFKSLTANQAQSACEHLKQLSTGCLVIAPNAR